MLGVVGILRKRPRYKQTPSAYAPSAKKGDGLCGEIEQKWVTADQLWAYAQDQKACNPFAWI